LGLSFVAWIVKAHHGTVQVESEQGKGTRFIVTLPLTLESSPGPSPDEKTLIA
jgi:signal transduction histidine kinase